MHNTQHGRLIDRRGFLSSVTLAGTAALAPQVVHAQAAGSAPPVRLAQAGTGAASSAPAIAVKSVERLAGSAASYAYGVKAGRSIFLNGHEAYDFNKGLTPDVEGPPGYRFERPPAASPRGRLHPQAHADGAEGVRHGSPADRARRPVLHKGCGGFGLSLGPLRRVRRIYPAEHLDHHGPLLHGAHQHPHLDAGDRARRQGGKSKRSVFPVSRFRRPATILPWWSTISCSSPATWRCLIPASCLPRRDPADRAMGRPDRLPPPGP